MDGLVAKAYMVFTPLLAVTDDAFRLALALQAPQLGPAECMPGRACIYGVAAVVSADVAFDGVRGLRRVDPLDDRAFGRLISAG